ncbi:MAG: hypothetical protein KAZ88_08890 [Acidimicrobiia bacterium]|jgi:hypothetical protein|nr:hypothetical protein [Acidimicrobiia bacterium]MBP8181093.1 hypothetical protein [Acidimicrobiia bacterium]
MPAALTVRVWDDPVITQHGYDPRSTYAEQFWLPTLGPSSLLLLRHLAAQFDATRGADITVPVAVTAQALGLGPREGKNSPLMRSFARLAQFDLAHNQLDSDIWSVRPKVPPVTQRHIRRLPETSLSALEAWNAQPIRPDAGDERLRRARRTAFILIENGELADHVERILLGQGFPPSACRPAVEWAAQRHSLALEAELHADRQPALTGLPQPATDRVDDPGAATEIGMRKVMIADRGQTPSARGQRDRTRPHRIPPPPSPRLTVSEV